MKIYIHVKPHMYQLTSVFFCFLHRHSVAQWIIFYCLFTWGLSDLSLVSQWIMHFSGFTLVFYTNKIRHPKYTFHKEANVMYTWTLYQTPWWKNSLLHYCSVDMHHDWNSMLNFDLIIAMYLDREIKFKHNASKELV